MSDETRARVRVVWAVVALASLWCAYVVQPFVAVRVHLEWHGSEGRAASTHPALVASAPGVDILGDWKAPSLSTAGVDLTNLVLTRDAIAFTLDGSAESVAAVVGCMCVCGGTSGCDCVGVPFAQVDSFPRTRVFVRMGTG